MQSNVASMALDGDKGTVSPTGTVKLLGAQGSEVRVIVNIMGRVRACTPTAGLRGYSKC
jgi:type IV fimbrial biogenesis protein FimT